MAELTAEDQLKLVELKHKIEGSSSVQGAIMAQFNALCMMGAFEQAEALRAKAHDYLDVFMDSCIENTRLCRKMQGLGQ
jgi:hypothetical protein